jgi:hypothetical protein
MTRFHSHRQYFRTVLAGTSLLLLTLFSAWSESVAGQIADSASEQSIKAAYLYKFASYVDWPDGVLDDPSTPLTIAVMGADALADELAVITGDRTVNGRSISVRRLQAEEALDGVHILFVGAKGTGALAALTPVAHAISALVVTESGDALELGSVINFRPVDQRIRFEVSLDSADKSRLRLSSRLLAVAEHVTPRAE